jgi:hypothetical protein
LPGRHTTAKPIYGIESIMIAANRRGKHSL